MLSLDPLGLDGVMLDEARAFLRVEMAEEDPSLASSTLAALAYAEQFSGQSLIRRTARETLSVGAEWQTLQAFPVRSINAVIGIPAQGAVFPIAPASWEAKIGSRGEAYVRILQPGSAGRVEVSAETGFSPDWISLPEPLRLGILRLAAHFYTHRDAPDDAGPPAAALALLLPWRRIRLS
jgi:uncharacterized phiE125 gp8 family phage protein